LYPRVLQSSGLGCSRNESRVILRKRKRNEKGHKLRHPRFERAISVESECRVHLPSTALK
jgi:hypothetical protein